MTKINRCFRLRHRPDAVVKDTDLELCEEPIPDLQDGQFLVKNLYISIDPTQRIWMSDRPQYMDPVAIGDVMRAVTIGEVVESKNDEYPVGTFVQAVGMVQDYLLVTTPLLITSKLPNNQPHNLSVCSLVIGLTAWHGVNKILQVGPNDTVCVSGAAGAVGSLVGQLSKLKGAKKVIGIAGGPTKCDYLTKELGYDAAVDYREGNVEEQLKAVAPDGITCYFDNVGGEVTEAVMANMVNFSKFAYCGSISEYNDKFAGIKNFNMILMRRMMVQGFICMDHAEEYPECLKELTQLLEDGKIKHSEHIENGLENYVTVLNMLFSGKNNGKLMIKV